MKSSNVIVYTFSTHTLFVNEILMECSSIQYIKLALKSDIIHQHTFSGRFILPVIAGERVLSSDTA